MSSFGIFCPPVPGHVNPFCALGRAVRRRGHRVVVFHIEDLASSIEAEGLEFVPLRDASFPPGTLKATTAKLAGLGGMQSLRFAIECACQVSDLILRLGPSAVRAAGIDALLVDQNEPAGGSVAEHLGMPFASICTSLPLNRDPSVPPPFVGWQFAESLPGRIRNRIAYAISDRFIAPIQATLNGYRERWKLARLNTPDDSFSRLAQIAQMPAAFDFPQPNLPSTFHYCGPFFDDFLASPIPFPFERLDGRPLIYGSLGTLQQSDSQYFRMIAESCSGLDAQLVLSLGSKGDSRSPEMPGNPIVVNYAPQLELLTRAAATITHSGMNTTQQSLYFGAPLVAVPLTHDQPAIAARLARTGAGVVLEQKRLNPEVLGAAVRSVLNTKSSYKANALRMQEASRSSGGVERAADIVESIL